MKKRNANSSKRHTQRHLIHSFQRALSHAEQVSIQSLNPGFIKVIISFSTSQPLRYIMSPRIKTKRSAIRKDLEVDQKAIKVLRNESDSEIIKPLKNVSDSEAFYFYENIGKPTGESAKSLSDFLEIVNTVKLESLQFHLERKDFQKWFRETLGDSELAESLNQIVATKSEKLRTEIHGVLEHHLEELKSAFVTFEVRNGELTVKN